MTVAAGIYIYDIENLEDINLIGHYPIPSSSLVWNSAKDGDLMFCAAGNACRIVDVSDPLQLSNGRRYSWRFRRGGIC